MLSCLRQLMALLFIVAIPYFTMAQHGPVTARKDVTGLPKPFKVSASGKQVSVKSTRAIQSLMVWTANGHRVVEQKEINNSSYSFTVPVNDKVFFMMLKLDGKVYTEKIGL